MLTYREGLRTAKELLEHAGVSEAEINAKELLYFVCDLDFSRYLFCKNERFPNERYAVYMQWIRRRAEHIPLQYLTCHQNFYGLDFYVNEAVLIPRLDTEVLVEYILKNETDGGSGLDVCTGSGCIAICLKKLGNFEHITALDVSEDALAVAEKNAKTHDVNIKWIRSDMFTQLSDMRYDFIVSNPPYICTDVLEELDVEVREHEPRQALDGDADGLKFYRILADESRKHLKQGGRLYLEIGYDQADRVRDLLIKSGFCDIRIIIDLAKKDRVVAARLSAGVDYV